MSHDYIYGPIAIFLPLARTCCLSPQKPRSQLCQLGHSQCKPAVEQLRAGGEAGALQLAFLEAFLFHMLCSLTRTTLGSLQRGSNDNRETRQDGGLVSKRIQLGPASRQSEQWKSLETSISTETQGKGQQPSGQENLGPEKCLLGQFPRGDQRQILLHPSSSC